MSEISTPYGHLIACRHFTFPELHICLLPLGFDRHFAHIVHSTSSESPCKVYYKEKGPCVRILQRVVLYKSNNKHRKEGS